ncbi:MAG TPA: hypothetical protein VLF91_03925 [Candidatus Saccharimonadales bacterium]|nr:hypothetical protein [Candidatus Saccharimonadales bacterium]
MVRFDRLQTSQPTTGVVCAKPATTATEASVQVVFPTGYTVNAVGNWTVSTATTTGWPGGAVAWPSIAAATNVTSQTVTFPSGDLTVGTLYCFNWNSTAALSVTASVSASNTGTVTTRTSTPTNIDTASYDAVSLSSDQINVSATVPQTFSLSLTASSGGSSDALGTLSTGSVISSSPGNTVTVNTNAANGFMVWGSDLGLGLKSGSTGSAIPDSPTAGTTNSTTLSAGTPGYNLGVTGSQSGGSGTLSIANGFNGASAGQGGGLDTTPRLLASSSGTASNAVLTLKNNVAIGTLTTAATDYSDAETITGAALF